LESGRFTLLRSEARFLDPHHVQLADGQIVKGRFFLIATGSQVATPALPGLAEAKAWTSDDVLDLEVLPDSVIVLGGGVVACELAQYLARMGSRVTQIQRSEHILKTFTPQTSETIETVFRAEGIELFTGTRVTAIERGTEGGVTVCFEHDGARKECSAAHLFNALGRQPATNRLDLAKAGVAIRDSGHIQCNAAQQTSCPHIYAAGDCAGPHEIVHIAILQGETAARHALCGEVEGCNEEHIVSVVFTDPQVASAGKSPAQLTAEGIDFVMADFPFDDHGKAILMEAKAGFVAIYAERTTGRLLGAECVGKDAGELIHSLAVGITLEATARDLLKVQWYHPTLSEIWTYPLEDIVEAMKTAEIQCGR
jgi:pyruvate/2-oxoglutarate dehydrogenase complex dihydrolipoamide dehydrogenase (E3) component